MYGKFNIEYFHDQPPPPLLYKKYNPDLGFLLKLSAGFKNGIPVKKK